MQKRAVIVHCWGGYPNYCWYPWAKQRLEERGVAVDVPALPNTDTPQLSEWLPTLKKIIGRPDENLFVITHSLGTITAMHYLSQLPEDVKIGGLVIVAGNTTDRGYGEMTSFFSPMPDLSKAATHLATKPELIYSDDDPWVPVSEGQEYHQVLGGNFKVLQKRGHFSGPIDTPDACTQLPEVIAAIEKLTPLSKG